MTKPIISAVLFGLAYGFLAVVLVMTVGGKPRVDVAGASGSQPTLALSSSISGQELSRRGE